MDNELLYTKIASPARVPKHRPLIGLVDPQEHLRETVHLIVVTPLRKGEIKLRKSLANRSFRTYRGRPLIATGPVPN